MAPKNGRYLSLAGWSVAALVLGVAVTSLAIAPPSVRGAAVVAADNVLASEAGRDVLARGGNAVDAAVAAALASGVVQPSGSGLGGGGFALVRVPGAQVALDFRETAPAAAHRDMYLGDDGQPVAARSRVGGLAVAVPGESRGLAQLVSRYGKLSHAEVAAPAVRYAANGFPIGAHLVGALARTKYDAVRQLYLVGGQRPARVGDTVRRPDLARTLRAWASSRGDDLYTGKSAASLVRAAQDAGGVLTAADLASYTTVDRTPLRGSFGDYVVVGMPAPSSGGVAILQALQVLDGYPLAELGHNSSDYLHLVAEVLKHVFADRAHYLGDPSYADVPVERLLSHQRRDEIRAAIWPGRTFPPEHYGALIAPPKDEGTLHISAMDAHGGAVALTTTVNTTFGSGVVVPGVGLLLNNEMDDFSAAVGVANAYGLIGSEANAIAPGKRPLSSMSPTLLLDAAGEPVLAVGASGGSFIISATLQVILNVTVFGMEPQTAVAEPRIHHQWQPDALVLEPGLPLDVHRALQGRGHTLRVLDRVFTGAQVVARVGDERVGGSDPRKGGWPAAVPPPLGAR